MTLTTLARLHLSLLDEANASDEPYREGSIHADVALQAAGHAWYLFEEVMKDVDEAKDVDETTATKAKEDLAATIHTYTNICIERADWETALPAAKEAQRLFDEVNDEW